jgi:hypothetical protein
MMREIEDAIQSVRNASEEEKASLVWAENDVKYQHTFWTLWRARHAAKKFIRQHKAEWREVDQEIADLPYRRLQDDLALASVRHAIMALFARASITERDFQVLTASYRSVFGPCAGISNAG